MYTSLDGLANNSIYTFYQDHFGYLWLATGLGLNRFDGTNFKKYGMSDGMPSLICNDIYEDHSGRMWISTRNGIAEFRKDSFYVYPNTDKIKLSYVFQIYENRQGYLIANTLQGEYRFNSKQWEPYVSQTRQNNDIVVTTIETKEGEYFNTGFEIFYKNKLGAVKSIWRHPSYTPFFRSLKYFDNQVYINTSSALFRIDSIHREQMFPNVLKNKTLLNYFKDSQKRWWFSTKEEGVLMLNESDLHIRLQALSIAQDYTSIFYEDREGQVWIGRENGVMKILPHAFASLEIREIKNGQNIRNLIPLSDRQFLLSVDDGHLLLIRYDIDQSPSYRVLAFFKLDGEGDFVDHYSIGKNGQVWMMTRDRQLYLLKDNKLENKTHLITDLGQLLALDVTSDSVSGQIVVATDSLLAIGNEYKLDTLFDGQHSFIEFPREVMFLGGKDLVIRTSEREVFYYSPFEHNNSSFIKLPILPAGNRTMKSDDRHRLWIYDRGVNLTCFDKRKGPGMEVEDVIDEASDNINTLFFGFTIDHDGSIWCVTSHGIQHIYKDMKKQWQSREYVVYEISHAANTDWYKVVESGNKIWVNLRNKLIYFDTKIPGYANKSGQVILEDVQLQNQTTTAKRYSDSLSGYFDIPSDITLRHFENTLTFFYNQPTTLEDQGTMYSYRLFPGDTLWSKPSANKSVSFNELKPAHYSFQVRSRNIGKEWSDPTLFSFTISKPFWDTTWFRILLLLMVSAFVAWIFRIRLRQERAKGEIKGQLLELEMRALRAQMNPHFIYNALNSIQSLVATNQTASANKYISKFARLLRQVLENSKRSEISLNQELESLRLYVDLEKLRLDEDVLFIENIDESILSATISVPPLILQPFVENALWHGLSSKEGEKKIELTITSDKEWIYFTITDNGIGRQKAAMLKSHNVQHESTALQNTEQRLRDFNGPKHSDPLKIEDLYSPEGSPLGTRICLQIRKKQNQI